MAPLEKKRNILRRIGRIVAKTIIIVIAVFLLLVLLVQTPPIQNLIRNKTVAYLEKKLQTRVEVGRIHIGLPRRIVLENIYVEDRQKDTLFSGGKVKASLNLFKLIFKNELDLRSIVMDDLTAKITRQLPDTVYNFQFVIDAFSPKGTNEPDTVSSAYAFRHVEFNNIRIKYDDIISGTNMDAFLAHLDTRVDAFDPEKLHFDVPLTTIKGLTARIHQVKPLATPEPEIKDLLEAATPSTMLLDFNEANLENIRIDYSNDVSAVITSLDIGAMSVKANKLDITNRTINLEKVSLENSTTTIRLGKKEAARVVEKEVKQEAKSQIKAGWNIRVASLDLANNNLLFDNDNHPKLPAGMDYAHLKGEAFTLQVDDLLLSGDSIGGRIKKGEFREQSGFVLEKLQGDVLYANKQAYLKDFLLKTPGTELKRYALLNYASMRDLSENFSRTQMEADISGSYVKVKDILAFAPQLSRQPAFSNPEATWYLNLQGSGTLESMHIENLQFRGLTNTQIDASGIVAANSNSNQTGGTLTIRKLHTTQSDLALFTGSRLSNDQVNLPEEFDASGRVAGGMNSLSVNLNIASSAGTAYVNGRFANLGNLATATYELSVSTPSLALGNIIRIKEVGRMSANLAVTGKGLTTDSYTSTFKGVVHALDYNDYTYRNIKVDGSVVQRSYTVIADMNDPNIDMNGTLTGNLSANPSFRFDGFVDSLRMLPLHFTTEPVVFRGKVEANVPVMNANYLEADVLITKALFVSATQRLALDSIQFTAGRNDSAQFMNLASDVATARISGQYRYTDLGRIFQKSIQPYFSVSPASTLNNIQPYDFSFAADINNSPILADFIPGLKSFEPIHIEGNLATNRGLTGSLNTPYIFYQGNEISGVNIKVNTTPNGLQFNGDIRRLKSGTFNVYRTQLNATALNNKIDFKLNMEDAKSRDRYRLSGLLNQPSQGVYTLNLRSDSLLLNYENWTVSPGNSLTITKDNLLADNFTLQKDEQKLSLQSSGQQLNVSFSNFQLSTITAFMKSDSIFANGSMNGLMTFRNILKQPVFTSDLTINDLSMKGDTLGNAVIKVDNTSGNKYTTKATITGRGNDISLTGSFTPQGANDIALDLDLAIRQMQLATMEGAFGGMLKNASGTVNGNIKISGTTNAPTINGPINFDKASFALTMLGSQFRVDGEKLTVTENGFHFDDFVIQDTANNILRLNGMVQTPNFTNFFFDLDVNADNFKVLNTTKKQNKLYYGELVVSTDLHIDGTEAKPIVDGSITVNDGTNMTIVIPQREPGVIEREGIVEFVDMDTPENDTLFRAYDSLNFSQFVGMDITTNIEIRKEAIFSIIIDEANGDFMKLQGEAVLTTGIDPSGKITLVGSYELEKGAYEITFNFLRRRFEIEKGSRIVWLHEPTKATMDVKAVYIANTSPIDLVQNQITAATTAIRNTYLQKLPFEVRLHMTGEILQPLVEFDIVLPDNKSYGVSNDIITQVQSRLAELRIDPGEINKQVFALLLLNRFVGQDPLASSTPVFSASSYVRQSVSKLLTEQLSKLAAGLIDGVDLTFDLTSTDDYTTGERRNRTDMNVALSKQLLNERLTVSVGTNFELEGSKNTKQKSSSAVGNVSVTYALTRDGRYMIRFYRKNEYQGVVDGYVIESGLSFIISVDYENFRELITKRKKQKVEGVK